MDGDHSTMLEEHVRNGISAESVLDAWTVWTEHKGVAPGEPDAEGGAQTAGAFQAANGKTSEVTMELGNDGAEEPAVTIILPDNVALKVVRQARAA